MAGMLPVRVHAIVASITFFQAERLKEGGVDDFHRKEDNFSMTQARLRSELRLQAGRAKPVDIISHNLESSGAAMRPDLKPWRMFDTMSHGELIDARRDIEAVAPAGSVQFNSSFDPFTVRLLSSPLTAA
jgi:hypothetical protein